MELSGLSNLLDGAISHITHAYAAAIGEDNLQFLLRGFLAATCKLGCIPTFGVGLSLW
jgi:hypothetical protein